MNYIKMKIKPGISHEHMVTIHTFQQLLKHIPQGGRRGGGGAISICGLVCPDS